MDYVKLEAIIKQFKESSEKILGVNVSPWVVLQSLSEVIAESKGTENLDSINESLPRDMIYAKIEKTTKADQENYIDIISEMLQNYIECDCEDKERKERIEKYNKLRDNGELNKKIINAVEVYTKEIEDFCFSEGCNNEYVNDIIALILD